MVAEPIASRSRDGRNIGNTATTGRDSNFASRHVELQPVKLLVHGRPYIRDCLGSQVLSNAKQSHHAITKKRVCRGVLCLAVTL
jgi:hypothetical protein